jgi:hypothetical protein
MSRNTPSCVFGAGFVFAYESFLFILKENMVVPSQILQRAFTKVTNVSPTVTQPQYSTKGQDIGKLLKHLPSQAMALCRFAGVRKYSGGVFFWRY